MIITDPRKVGNPAAPQGRAGVGGAAPPANLANTTVNYSGQPSPHPTTMQGFPAGFPPPQPLRPPTNPLGAAGLAPDGFFAHPSASGPGPSPHRMPVAPSAPLRQPGRTSYPPTTFVPPTAQGGSTGWASMNKINLPQQSRVTAGMQANALGPRR